MARGLDEIIRELDASYNPQRQSINERLNALPAQADAEIKGLEGQQTQAFDSILAGARGRGLGFSGIPIAEQAQYTSSQFLPAVARVRQSQNENRRSLADALNNIGLEQNKFAQSIRQSELDRDWQREQFERQLAAEERARAAAASFSPSFGGNATAAPQSSGKAPDPLQQLAYNDVATRVGNNDDKALISDFLATQNSANRGNAKDKLKIQVYQKLRPDLFLSPSANYLGRQSYPQQAPKQQAPQKAYQAPNILRGLGF